jgi:hypothetical protein
VTASRREQFEVDDLCVALAGAGPGWDGELVGGRKTRRRSRGALPRRGGAAAYQCAGAVGGGDPAPPGADSIHEANMKILR